MSGSQDAFEHAHTADHYDIMVDWDARLAREVPFFDELFEEAGVESVADVGCGTGMHSIEFAGLGLEVFSVDPSEAMLSKAARNAEDAGVTLDLRQAGFGELDAKLGGPVDALVSLGNAFINVEGAAGALETLADFAAVMDRGGVLVLHFLNHDRLLAKRPRMMPARFRETDEGERIFVRTLSYPEGEIEFEFITLSRKAPGADWEASTRRSSHSVLLVDEVVEALGETGFERVELFGDHERAPFDPEVHESVIIVAHRS